MPEPILNSPWRVVKRDAKGVAHDIVLEHSLSQEEANDLARTLNSKHYLQTRYFYAASPE